MSGGIDHAKFNIFQYKAVHQNMIHMIFDDFFLQLLHFEIFDFLCWLFRMDQWRFRFAKQKYKQMMINEVFLKLKHKK